MAAHTLNSFFLEVEKKKREYVEVLKELVKKESLSGQEGRVGEGGVANSIWMHLQDIGVDAAFQEVSNSHNVVCEFGEGSRCIVFSAHMDIVSAGDTKKWLVNPFNAENGIVKYLGDATVEINVSEKSYIGKIRDQMDAVWREREEKEREIIYGRGSFDNKASIAILLFLIDLIKDVELNGKVYAAFTVREEVDGAGIKRFIEKKKGEFENFKKRYAVVLEGSYSFTPVIAHRGVCWAYIKTRGKRSHASTPHLGKNAIVEMCRIVNNLERCRDKIIQELHSGDELLGKPTFSVTSIVGGGIKKIENGVVHRIDLNTIPDFCEASLDIRFGRNVNAEKVKKVFIEKIERVSKDFEFVLEEDTFYPAAGIGKSIKEAAKNDLIRAAMESGGIHRLEIAPGATEGAFLHAAGLETLVEFGPAGAFSHAVHEYVEVDEIERGAKVLLSLLNKLKFL